MLGGKSSAVEGTGGEWKKEGRAWNGRVMWRGGCETGWGVENKIEERRKGQGNVWE